MKSRTFNDTSTFYALDYVYDNDASVKFKNKKTYYTAEGFGIPTIGAFESAVDCSTNRGSNLYLTRPAKLSDLIEIDLDRKKNLPFVTYLADTYGVTENVDPETLCWHVESSPQSEEEMKSLGIVPHFNSNTKHKHMNNDMLFEINTLNDIHVVISHSDGYKKTYLTYNNTLSTLYFDFNHEDHDLHDVSDQVFEYSYDDETHYISLYKQLSGVYYNITKVGGDIRLQTTTGDLFIPNSYKTTGRPDMINRGALHIDDIWVSYTREMSNNNLNIDLNRSYPGLSHNFILNTQYVYNDLTVNRMNIMALKNHLTNHYEQSRANPFRNSSTHNVEKHETEPDTMFRDYTSLATGTNQIEGTEKMHATFRDYTELLEFPTDKLTYFHMPQDMYPYKRINVSDAGLIESGSIAGDQPIRSDKVFKKRANYKDYSEWGNSIDEQSGQYLCTWLYWSGKEDEQPMWLDRYYNPNDYTIYSALTARPLVELITTFDNMVLDNPGIEKYTVFDKISDLCFEPGVLYCYHRIGQTDVDHSISKLNSNIIQQDFLTYRNTNNNNIPVFYEQQDPVYSFTGQQYSTTKILTEITDENSFCVSFSMYSDDWSKSFGYQLIGNYNNTGFGVFNQQLYTPVYIKPGDSTKLINTDMKTVLTLPISSRYAFKNGMIDNLYVYNDDNIGTLYEYDLNGVLRERTNIPLYDYSVYPPEVIKPMLFTNDEHYLYMVYDDKSYATIDLQTEAIDLHEDAIVNISNSSKPIQSVVVVHGKLYALDTPQDQVTNIQDKIYWRQGNVINMHDTNNEITVELLRTDDYHIKSYTVDRNQNIYVVYRELQPEPYTSNYIHYLLKMDVDDRVVYQHNIHTFNATLSAIKQDTVFKMYSGAEDLGGDYVDRLYLYTNYLSTTELYNPEADEFEQTQINTVLNTYIDTTGDQLTTKLSYQIANIDDYGDIDNVLDKMIKTESYKQYNDSNNPMIFKLKLINTYNRDKYEEVVFTVDVSELDPGWHQIAYDYNSTLGNISLFIDSKLMHVHSVPPGKYRFSPTSIQQYLIGTASAYSGVLYNEFLKQPGRYMSKNYKIKQFKIFNKSINYYDIKFMYRKIKEIQDIKWTIPSNSRNYVDEISHVFMHNKPTTKTNYFDINVLADQLHDTDLQRDLASDIIFEMYNQTPIRAAIDKIKWHQTT